jgi:23S rRNA pseudouridine1911/1915/1917 synthase
LSDRLLIFDYKQPEPQRLDKFLVSCLPEFSRARLQGLIADGFVLIDQQPAKKSGQMLAPGAQVQVRIPPTAPSDLLPEAIPLDILYENDDLLVINKPAGMVVHPAAGHTSGTLVHAALAHAPEMAGVGGEKRPGVVHRLDKDTSGIILLAKNDAAHHWLQDQFRLRKTKKVYLALVDGNPPTPEGRIEAPIGRNTSHRKLMGVTEAHKGRAAVSEYFTRETFRNHTLLEVHPLTGRTHQIRVHLAFIGCPVAADPVYGHRRASLPLKRHFLHAWKLTIRLLGEEQPRTFEAPLAAELAQILEYLKEME